MPKISVVIPTLNEEKYLSSCLESFRKQSFTDFEIIISDGGSTDKTTEIAKRYTKNIIVHPNSNVCLARDLGTRAARGTIVVGADADTLYPKNHLELIYQHFQQDPKVVAVVGGGKVVDGTWISKKYWEIAYFIIYIIYRLTDFILYAPAFDMSFRKDLFLKMEGYNVNLDFGGDELDVLAKLKKTKGRLIFEDRLHPLTSGRRYKVGFFTFLFKHALIYYWLGYFSGKIFGKSLIKAKPVR